MLVGVGVAPSMAASPADIDFARDIRPIFEANCYKCHDAAKHKGGLRLDSKATAFIGGDSGDPAIVPHDPDHSKMVQLVRGDDPSSVMPPKGDRLTKTQVDLIVRWVKGGAAWPDGIDRPAQALTHWSFIKPKRPAIPTVKLQHWVRNPIDAFVLANLERNGLEPSHEADRYTLVRRLYLDLIGLPPTPKEVADFVNDNSPGAYEALVDRLQANPHYGERWARQWLDLGRYADSAGYGSDPLRFTTWRWRDWVIDAINKDLPYDQFTIDQIAGDLLPHPTTDQLIATAFNRNTMTNTEGGTDPEEFRVAAIKDRVDTTIQVWMGLTMGCAQCHTHKYDPITNREYYQLFAIFNETEDANRADEAPTIATPTAEQQKQVDALQEKIAAAKQKMDDRQSWADAQAEWEKSLPSMESQWKGLPADALVSLGGAEIHPADSGAFVASGAQRSGDTYVLTTRPKLAGITAFRLKLASDSAFPTGAAAKDSFRAMFIPESAESLRGRFVRIDLPGKQKMLSLAEVQVFRGGKNIAPNGKASQSSTAFNAPAKLAIDGNTDGQFEHHSTTHTDKSTNPWWEVDLKQPGQIDRIAIWNRTDFDLGSRLGHFRVRVLDENRKRVWETTVDQPPMPSMSLDPSELRRLTIAQISDSAVDLEEGGAETLQKHVSRKSSAHSRTLVFRLDQPLDARRGALMLSLLQQGGANSIGPFRVEYTTSKHPEEAVPANVANALATAADQRSDEQKDLVFRYFQKVSQPMQAMWDEVASLNRQIKAIPVPQTAIMRELPADKRRENHILIKGNFLNKGAKVDPAVLAAFEPLPKGAPNNRLGLAEWIVDKDNPLTARVEVNRLWAQLFGVGIVETQEDFGTQGQPPSDQALLDWLAVEFMNPSSAADKAWDMKRMVKMIVMSAAYRQSSAATPALLESDPHDRLISRSPRRRLEAELVRDQALSLSGLISLTMHGPSVYPPQPDGLWQAAFNGQRTYPTSTGPDQYRRGIYVFWRRTVPYPSMNTFDAPSREVCTLRRIQTSTPLQAFVTLNDPVYVECAQALARRIINEGGTTARDRAKFGLELCLCRPAEAKEIDRVLALHDRELDRYRDDAEAAKKLAVDPLGPLPKDTDTADAAAWTVCANVLLNLDGVLSKR